MAHSHTRSALDAMKTSRCAFKEIKFIFILVSFFSLCVFIIRTRGWQGGAHPLRDVAATPPYGVKLYVKVSNCCLYTHDSLSYTNKLQHLQYAHQNTSNNNRTFCSCVDAARIVPTEQTCRDAAHCANVKNVYYTSVISQGDAECAPLANIISTAAVPGPLSCCWVISKKVGARAAKSALIQPKLLVRIAYCALDQPTAFGCIKQHCYANE